MTSATLATKVGQASRLPSERASAREEKKDMLPRRLRRRGQARRLPYFSCHSTRKPGGHLSASSAALAAGRRTYFVTFRLADSIPQDKSAAMGARLGRMVRSKTRSRIQSQQRAEYHERFTERFHQWLDAGIWANAGCGARTLSAIVEEALRLFDGQRYVLGHYVVMPNHVHVVVRPVEGHLLKDILHSWKSFTCA